MKFYGRLFSVGILTMLFAAAAWAADPPGSVARLQYMSGSVSIQPRGTEDWVQGSANRPLTNADNVWADKDSRAELNLGTALMQMNSETSLTLANVSNEAVQVQLHQGTLNLHIKHLYDGEVYEVDTPNLAFTVTKPGDYRFDTDPNGDSTLVTVRRGEGEATGKGPAVKVKSGKQARFTGGTSLANQIMDAPQPDSFDEWSHVRDEREDHSLSAKYVAPGVVGSEDLDTYGTWRETPEYGRVWVPASVPPDWAPYRYGHWVWIDPWGWTWVDDAPWGFAPFHYGRWVSWGGYWGWAPGPYWVRPWYAPAMVAWFGGPGWGVGWGFGFGFGWGGWGWGWAPLGWREPFYPWWGRCSPGYFRNVNISNTRITNINNVTNVYNHSTGTQGFYGNRSIGTPRYGMSHNGLTAASNNTLRHSLPVNQNMAKVPESALHNLPSAKGPEVSPTHDSMLGPKAGLPAARPTSTAASRPTVSRMTAPAAPARTGSPESSAARGSESQAARGPEASSARNSAAPAASRGPESAPAGTHSATGTSPTEGRDVARPGSTEGASGIGNAAHSAPSNYVPRPPSAWGSRSLSGGEPSRSGPSQMAMNTGPRPPEGSLSRPTVNSGGSSTATRSYSSPGSSRGGGYSVPRPTGPVRPAPSESASSGYGRSWGGSSNESGAYHHGYGQGRSYGSSGGSYGRSSSPSHSSGGSHGGWGGSHGGSSGGSHGGGGGHR